MAVDTTADERPDRLRRWRNPSRTTVVVAAITVVALFLRLYRLTRPGQLYGVIGYDDGVYFGASIELVHGNLPYQDFVFVHPPLLPILMTPFALLTKAGMATSSAFAVARVFTAIVSAACVPLLGRLLRHRGTPTVAVGCAVLTLQSDSVAAGHSVFLEPYVVIFCLGAMLAIFDGDRMAGSNRRLVLGGVLLGLACAVKLFALAPLAVLLLVALPKPARALRIAIGSAVGFLVPCVPFLLAAPHAFVRDVVVSQLNRTSMRTAMDFRVTNLIGTDDIAGLDRGGAFVVAAIVVVLLAAAYTLVWRGEHRRATTLE